MWSRESLFFVCSLGIQSAATSLLTTRGLSANSTRIATPKDSTNYLRLAGVFRSLLSAGIGQKVAHQHACAGCTTCPTSCFRSA